MSSLIPAELFSDDQWQKIYQLLQGLDDRQSIWLSGFLAARSQGGSESQSDGQECVAITYGTETGNCRHLAQMLAEKCRDKAIEAEVIDLATFRTRRLAKLDYLVVITATHGDGAPPEPIEPFYDDLMSSRKTLHGLKYAVLALGDSSYEKFCATGVLIDERLELLGAQRLLARQDCDVDFEKTAFRWMETLTELLPSTALNKHISKLPAVALSKATYTKDNPLLVEVLANRKLSDASSPNPIHHLELAFEEQDFSLSAGDAVGILPENTPELVSLILDLSGLSGEQPISMKGEALSLVEGLRRHRDLSIPGKAFLEYWSEISGDQVLSSVVAGNGKAVREFLRNNQVCDILQSFPAHPSPQLFFDALRPIQPRLYDVANCLATIPEELHLTIKLFDYSFLDRVEKGVASGYLVDMTVGDSLLIYPHRNARFQLPENPKVPIVLIAEGTGIAPYRAFIQALSGRKQCPETWLVFAEKRFEQDFLYQLEIQKAKADGVLTFIDTLFYRDGSETQIADLLIAQTTRLVEWLEKDGHVYFCGDKSMLDACERGVQSSVDNQKGDGYWTSLVKDKRIHRNLY